MKLPCGCTVEMCGEDDLVKVDFQMCVEYHSCRPEVTELIIHRDTLDITWKVEGKYLKPLWDVGRVTDDLFAFPKRSIGDVNCRRLVTHVTKLLMNMHVFSDSAEMRIVREWIV